MEDETRVTRMTHAAGENSAVVELDKIEGGGHTWPGGPVPFPALGTTTLDISANDLIWEFFEQHPLPEMKVE